MIRERFGPHFGKVFTVAILEEVSFILLVHFPGYLDGLGVTEGLIGVLYAGAGVLALLFRPVLGRVLDLTHRRTVLLATGVLNALVIVALTTTTAWGGWLWALFLTQRVLQIVFFTTMLTYAADSMPVEHRTQGLALFGLSGLLPISIGGVLGDFVIDEFGFDALFLLAAAAGLTAWSLIWRLPVLPVLGRRPRRSFWAALVQRDLLPLWWVSLCFTVGMETVFTFTRTYVEDRGIGTAGLFFGVYGVIAAVTRVAGGRHYDRIPQRPLLTGAIVTYGLGLAAMALAGSMPLFVAAALLAGTAHGAVFPILTSQVVARSRTAERGSAMAIFTSIFDIALLLAAPSVGLLIDGFDYRLAFGVVATALAIGSVVYAVWDRRMVAAALSA